MKSAYMPPHKRSGYQSRSALDKIQKPVTRKDSDVNEVEVVFRKSQNLDWIGEYKSPLIRRKLKLPSSGARSLVDMARTKCISESRNFTPEHFETIPWSLAATIWAEVVETHAESFHTWRTFATAFNGDHEFGMPENRYHLVIKQPVVSIQEYYRGLCCVSGAWLTALRISPKQVTVPDIVAIANINSLTVLDLSDDRSLTDTTLSPLDERIIRTWAELAMSGRAFQKLRVLMFGWQDNITVRFFNYIDHFPKLQYIVCTDCKHLHQKNRTDWEDVTMNHGWVAYHAKRSAKLLRPLLDDKQSQVGTVSNFYYFARGELGEDVRSTRTEHDDRLPIVECSLGTPRRWTHILDEFPGTRTILFQREDRNAESNSAGIPSRMKDTESIKRLRDTGGSPQAMSSPPRKRQGVKAAQRRAPVKTAASLLADLGM